jgi:acyl-coenzyme A thioesterase PaaI-like protein
MTVFDEATAVRRRSEGVYDARPDQRFAIVTAGGSTPPAVNGGALIAQVLRAVLDSSPNPHPVATTANFLRVAKLAPAQVRVEWLKQGRTASVARASLVQDGELILDLSVTTGTVLVSGSAQAAPVGRRGGPPARPRRAGAGPAAGLPADRGLRRPRPVARLGLGRRRGGLCHAGVRPHGPRDQRLAAPEPVWRAGDARLLRLAGRHAPGPLRARPGPGRHAALPTVELTWYMRAVPQPGPLRVATRVRHVGGGWFDEEAEVWDTAGTLVAQSRQLARVGRGPVRPRPPVPDAAAEDATGYSLS